MSKGICEIFPKCRRAGTAKRMPVVWHMGRGRRKAAFIAKKALDKSGFALYDALALTINVKNFM